MLKVLKQAKENQDCEEYNFIFGIFLLPLVSSGDKTRSWPHGLSYCVGHGSDFVRKLRRKIKIKMINTFNQYGLGVVVRALAFHQCVPGSIPGPGVICGLSLLVLYSAPRGFSPGTPVFPSPQKPTFDLI